MQDWTHSEELAILSKFYWPVCHSYICIDWLLYKWRNTTFHRKSWGILVSKQTNHVLNKKGQFVKKFPELNRRQQPLKPFPRLALHHRAAVLWPLLHYFERFSQQNLSLEDFLLNILTQDLSRIELQTNQLVELFLSLWVCLISFFSLQNWLTLRMKMVLCDGLYEQPKQADGRVILWI